MLPVATPPNARVFALDQLTITLFARARIWMNLVGLVLITAFSLLLDPLVWGAALRKGLSRVGQDLLPCASAYRGN